MQNVGEVWDVVRKWAGVKTTGLKFLTYCNLLNAWTPGGDISASEFFYVSEIAWRTYSSQEGVSLDELGVLLITFSSESFVSSFSPCNEHKS